MMDEDRITLEEWRAMSGDDQLQYMRTLESLLIDAQRVLAEIPPCPDHGYCTSWFRRWVRLQQGKESVSDDDGEMLVLDRALRFLAKQKTPPNP